MSDSPVKMEARAATVAPQARQSTIAPQAPEHDRRARPWADAERRRPPPVDAPRPGATSSGTDPFGLGLRHRLRATPDGRRVVEQVPLCPEDLLYPQEGDVVADGYPHNEVLHPKADSVRRNMKKQPDMLVTCNVVIVLRCDGKTCAPDIAVIQGEIDRSTITCRFGAPLAQRGVNLQAVGGDLVFALEVVSTSQKAIEKKDTEGNLERYAREGVPEYFTVYPIREQQVKDLVGRRLRKGDWVEIPPDEEGRVYSEKLDLYFQIDAQSKELLAFDAKTDQRLLISDEEEAGRKSAEAALGEAETTLGEAETALGEAETALGEAETALAQEAKARRQAEQEKLQAEQEKLQVEQKMAAEIERLRARLRDAGST